VFPMIWGEPKKAVEWKGQPLGSIAPKLVFMVALVAMGIYLPRSVNNLFREVARSLPGGAP